jgi:ribose transport system substrate-binding protein
MAASTTGTLDTDNASWDIDDCLVNVAGNDFTNLTSQESGALWSGIYMEDLETEAGKLGRRDFLELAAVGGVAAIAGSTLLAACSSSTKDAAATSRPNNRARLSEFTAYDPAAPGGSVPRDLPKSVAFFTPVANEYYKQISDNIAAACRARGLDYQFVVSETDPVRGVDQISQALQKGVGGVIVQPDDAKGQAVVLQRAIDAGVHVIFFVTPPATAQTTSDQYALGYGQGKGAVEWINAHMGGKAKVCNFLLDHIEALVPRRLGTEAALREGGAGIELVESLELVDINQDEGFKLASTLLQKNPDINAWIGPDETVLGVNAYLTSKGAQPATDKIYASGLNGSVAGQDAVSKGTFVRDTWAFNDPLIAYGYGQFIADWLEGKSVPQVYQVAARKLASRNDVLAFRAATSDPSVSFEDYKNGKNPAAKLWGNITYDTRDQYIRNIITGG